MSNPESPEIAAGQPAIPPRKKADKSTLAKGCAIGCGVLIVLGIFGGIGGYFVVRSMMDKVGDAMSARLAEEFAVMKESGQVPDEHAVLYQEIVDFALRPETTFTGAVLATTVVKSNLEDGQVNDAERQEAEDTRDLFQENPEVGMFAVDNFMDEHPGLKERAEQVQRTMNPATLLAPK